MHIRQRNAFTVIELLVAVGVTALLVTLMINIVSTVLTNWNRTSGSLSSGNQARLVLDQISQDLQGALLKTDSNVWIAATVQTSGGTNGVTGASWSGGKPPSTTDSLNLTATDPEDYRFGQGGVWLRFFTIPSGENDPNKISTISAPRAVAYQIYRVKVGGGDQYAYQLYRSEVTPDLTFTQGYNLYESGGYNTESKAALGSVQNIRCPVEEQVIGTGIVDFGVKFYVKDVNDTDGDTSKEDTVEVFPVDKTASATATDTSNSFAATSITSSLADPSGGASPTTAFPVAAEVMIRVLTPEGIRLLEAHESGLTDLGEWWDDIVIPNSQVYTRRIDLKSTAL